MKNKKVNRIALAMSFGLLITLSASMMQFSANCDNLRGDLLRLHILANSDSPEDQAAKLAVRNRLQTEFAGLFSGAETEAEAEEIATENLSLLENAAEEELIEVGAPADVTVKLIDRYFTTTEYERFVLPAGEYRTLQVSIGDAKGHNWWCVAFPPLCLSAADGGDKDVVLTPEQEQIIRKSGGYKIKFKLVELYQELKKKLSGKK